MTVEKMQDPWSTPATKHLTPVQRAVFNQALSSYASSSAREAEIEAELRTKVHSGAVKLTFTGDETGHLQYLRIDDVGYADNAEIRLALLHEQESTGDQPSVHFMTAVVTGIGDQAEATDVRVLDLDELRSRIIEVEYRYNNTGCRSVCPLTGEVFKPHFGDYPFLAGTWDPVFEGSLPPAGPANTDPSRSRWTVGEVQEFLVAQWRAESLAREKAVVPAPPQAVADTSTPVHSGEDFPF